MESSTQVRICVVTQMRTQLYANAWHVSRHSDHSQLFIRVMLLLARTRNHCGDSYAFGGRDKHINWSKQGETCLMIPLTHAVA